MIIEPAGSRITTTGGPQIMVMFDSDLGELNIRISLTETRGEKSAFPCKNCLRALYTYVKHRGLAVPYVIQGPVQGTRNVIRVFDLLTVGVA